MQPDTAVSDTAALHRRVVSQFVTRHVMLGEAKANEVPVDSARLARRMRRTENRYEDEAGLQAALRERGLTLDSLRTQRANTLRIQELAQQWASQIEPPSSSEIQEYRNDPDNREVRVRHILLRVEEDAHPDTVDSIRARAYAIADSIQAGSSFAAMAERHSDAATAPMGGMMRSATLRQMEQPFADAILDFQNTGAVTDEPIRTDEGFHLLKLVDQQTPTRGHAKWRLFAERRQSIVREKQRELVAKATVHVNPAVVRANVLGN